VSNKLKDSNRAGEAESLPSAITTATDSEKWITGSLMLAGQRAARQRLIMQPQQQ
jgi:hypothetical protein